MSASCVILGDSQVKYISRHVADGVTCISRPGYIVRDLQEDAARVAPFFDVVVLHVGTNDVSRSAWSQTAGVYERMIQLIRTVHPDVCIVISGILPRHKDRFTGEDSYRTNDLNRKASIVNEELKDMAIRLGVCFLSLWNIFLDRKNISWDGLHLSPDGCRHLAEALTTAAWKEARETSALQRPLRTSEKFEPMVKPVDQVCLSVESCTSYAQVASRLTGKVFAFRESPRTCKVRYCRDNIKPVVLKTNFSDRVCRSPRKNSSKVCEKECPKSTATAGCKDGLRRSDSSQVTYCMCTCQIVSSCIPISNRFAMLCCMPQESTNGSRSVCTEVKVAASCRLGRTRRMKTRRVGGGPEEPPQASSGDEARDVPRMYAGARYTAFLCLHFVLYMFTVSFIYVTSGWGKPRHFFLELSFF